MFEFADDDLKPSSTSTNFGIVVTFFNIDSFRHSVPDPHEVYGR